MHLCTGSEIWNLIRNPADQRSDPCDLRDHRIPSREWCFTQLFINKPLAFGNDGQPWLTMVNPVILSYLYINHFFKMGMIYNWVYHVYPCPSFIFNMITHTHRVTMLDVGGLGHLADGWNHPWSILDTLQTNMVLVA